MSVNDFIDQFKNIYICRKFEKPKWTVDKLDVSIFVIIFNYSHRERGKVNQLQDYPQELILNVI